MVSLCCPATAHILLLGRRPSRSQDPRRVGYPGAGEASRCPRAEQGAGTADNAGLFHARGDCEAAQGSGVTAVHGSARARCETAVLRLDELARANGRFR